MIKQRHIYMNEAGDGTGGAGGTGGTGGGAGGTGAPAGSGTGQTVDYSALSANYKQALSAEYQTHPALADIKDLNGLVKSYVNAQQMVGADKIVVPRTDAPPEEWNNFFNKLGRPENPQGYNLKEVPLPENLPRDESMEKFANDLFHKHGVTAKQGQELYKEFATFQAQQLTEFETAQAAKVKDGIDALRKEWGNKFDGEIALAKQAVTAFGGESLKAFLDETGMGDHPLVIKVFNNIGKALGEDKTFRDGSLGNGFAPGEDQAKAEIARLQTDQSFMKAYMNRDDPTHAAAKTRMDNLWKTAYPGQIREG